MRVTLIKPNIGRKGHSLYVDETRMEPLALGVLAALTPPDVEVKLYDDRMEAVPFDKPTDLVALGGMHVNLLPEEAARHCDAIVLGDAETQWATVVEDARRGKLQAVYRGAFPALPQGRTLPRIWRSVAATLFSSRRSIICWPPCESCAAAAKRSSSLFPGS